MLTPHSGSDLEPREIAVRTDAERREHEWLSSLACFSDANDARPVAEAPDPFRPAFVRDRDRIVHCGAFRRLKDKTQVFVIDEGDFYRTLTLPCYAPCQAGSGATATPPRRGS